MIFFIIGVVAALFALAVLLLAKEYKNSAIIPAVVAVVMIGISCVSYVPTGYTGIVTTFGKVDDGTKDAGVVFKQPWQSIVKIGMVQRQLGVPADKDYTASGKKRWKPNEKLVTMPSPSGSAMHHTVWEMQEQTVEQMLQDNTERRVRQLIANAKRKGVI